MRIGGPVAAHAPDPPPGTARQELPGRRAALDGVRGLAIALVVLHHMSDGLERRPAGGFLGVDVFFVLSGYLITGLLVRSWERTGRVGLLGFWLRRARRLLPPLLVVLALLALLVRWVGAAEQWPRYRGDALAALMYTANLHLADGLDAAGRPLHAALLPHTWSLAVEEQFYLAWPLLLAGLLALGVRRGGAARGRQVALVGCLVMAAASFGWLAAARLTGPAVFAYVDTRGRVGELLAGAALALALPVLRSRVAGRAWTVLAAAGLVVVGVCVAAVDQAGPGYYHGGAAAVSLATVLVVAGVEAAPAGPVARALAVPPLAGLGLVSYTLYLVHYPVAVLFPLPDDGSTLALLQVQVGRLWFALGFAVLSYRLLERPLLTGRLPWVGGSPPRLALAGGAAVATCVAVVLWSTSLPGDLDRQLLAEPSADCAGRGEQLTVCTLSDGSERWVVTGDAQAAGLATALSTVPGLGVTRAAWRGCAAGGPPDGSPGTPCARDAARLVEQALSAPGTSALVVADATTALAAPDGAPARLAALLRLVDAAAARGVPTVLVRQPPPGADVGEFVTGEPVATDPGRAEQVRAYAAMLADVAAARPGSAHLISVDDLVCPGGACTAVVDGLLVRHDVTTYAPAFARRLAPELAARVGAALTPPRRAG